MSLIGQLYISEFLKLRTHSMAASFYVSNQLSFMLLCDKFGNCTFEFTPLISKSLKQFLFL